MRREAPRLLRTLGGPSVVACTAILACLLSGTESIAATHQLKCTVTMRYNVREQRSELRMLQFVYDDREGTLFYVDDGGRAVQCINGVVGTLEILGSCGPTSTRIDRSTYQLESNTFDYQWNPRRRRTEETWSYGDKGTCTEDSAPQE